MDMFKQKWKNYTIQRRLKDLWEEYLRVSHLKDDLQTYQKFKQYLDEANLAVKAYVQTNDSKEKLEEMLGDIGGVLDSILQYLNKFQEIQNKQEQSETVELLQAIFEQSLQLAEFILRDPKYRKTVESSHNVLGDFLNLMEKAQKSESKVIIVKLLVLFSETMSQRIEFFEQQGFHRLLQIVMTRDPKLSRVISKALLHFLSIEDICTVDFELDLEHQSTEDAQQVQSIKTKISKIALDFRKFAFKELQKVFLNKGEKDNKDEQIKQDKQIDNKMIEDVSLICALEKSVSYESIFEADLALYVNMQASRSTSDCQEEQVDSFEDSPPQKEKELKQQQPFQSEDQLVKEFKVLQGGFKAILEMFSRATDDVQIDLMRTIQRILSSNERHKQEFKKINGYDFLSLFFLQKEDQNQEFLGYLFQFLQDLIYNNSNVITDFDAFILLMELLCFSKSELITTQSFCALESILQSNWKNVFTAKRLKLVYFIALFHLRSVFDSKEINSIVSNISNEFIQTGFKQCLKQKEFPRFTKQFQLPNFTNLLFGVAQLEGVYSLETESIYSQLVVNFLPNIDEEIKSFTSLLFNILNLKLTCQWRKIHTFDHLSEILYENLSILFTHYYRTLNSSRKKTYSTTQQSEMQECTRGLIELISIINRFLSLSCQPEQNQLQQDQTEQNPHFIQSLVNQNRQEQLKSYLMQSLKRTLLETVDGFYNLMNIFLFDVSNQDDLASTILNYRLNQTILQCICHLLKENETFFQKFNEMHGPDLLLYLVYSQYEMYQQLLTQSNQLENPVNELAQMILLVLDGKRLDYLITLFVFFSKSNLNDQCSPIFENLCKLISQQEFQKQTKLNIYNDINLVQFITLRLIHLLPKYNHQLNLYASMLQLLEHLLVKCNTEELDVLLDYTLNGETIKRLSQDDEFYGSVLSDFLSIIGVHCMISSSQGIIVDKLLQGEYLVNILGFLETSSVQVKLQAFKVCITMYILNTKLKKSTSFTQKGRFFNLVQKLMIQNEKGDFNNQFCSTIYKLVFWGLDSYHVLFPENTSQVSSVMNRSEYAEILVKAQKLHLESQSAIMKIQNIDILELFFLCLSKNPNTSYHTDVLKVFESILNAENIQILLDVPNFLQWFIPFISQGQKETEICLKIIIKILMFDFAKTPKQSKFVDILKRTPQVEDVIKQFLNELILNPLIKDQHLLKNLQQLLSCLDELVGFNENINVMVLHAINLLASKNSPQVRTTLKTLNLFEIRDQLVFQILRYDLEPERLTSVLGGISFNQLCGQKQFKDSHCMAFLVRKLLKNKNHFGLQMLIIKILKYDITQSEENQKYVAKILQNDQLIQFFYPQLLKKQQRNFRCLTSKQSEENKIENDDKQRVQTPPKDQFEIEEKQVSLSPNQNKVPQQPGPNSTVEDFLRMFYSQEYEDDRKQIDLYLDKVLIPVENENMKQQAKLNTKKKVRTSKLQEILQQEQLTNQTTINEWELKIQSRLKKSTEKMKLKQSKLNDLSSNRLEQGETVYFQNIQHETKKQTL